MAKEAQEAILVEAGVLEVDDNSEPVISPDELTLRLCEATTAALAATDDFQEYLQTDGV